MNLADFIWAFLRNPKYAHGYDSIGQRALEHLQYTAEAFALAAAIGLAFGLLTGHTGRGDTPVSALAAIARALPSLGLLVLLAVKLGLNFNAVLIPLVALAVAPVLLNTHAGIRAVDPAMVDAARGMGMRPWQVLLQVEIPAALPLIINGLRSAAVQIVATATIAAFPGYGGFGRYIVDGYSEYDYSQVAGGAFLVAMLSLLMLGFFALLSRLAVSPGVRRRG